MGKKERNKGEKEKEEEGTWEQGNLMKAGSLGNKSTRGTKGNSLRGTPICIQSFKSCRAPINALLLLLPPASFYRAHFDFMRVPCLYCAAPCAVMILPHHTRSKSKSKSICPSHGCSLFLF